MEDALLWGNQRLVEERLRSVDVLLAQELCATLLAVREPSRRGAKHKRQRPSVKSFLSRCNIL